MRLTFVRNMIEVIWFDYFLPSFIPADHLWLFLQIFALEIFHFLKKISSNSNIIESPHYLASLDEMIWR